MAQYDMTPQTTFSTAHRVHNLVLAREAGRPVARGRSAGPPSDRGLRWRGGQEAWDAPVPLSG